MRTVSFRDPDGFIFPFEEKICRVVAAEAAGRLLARLDRVECRRLIEQGKLVWTKRAGAETAARVLASGDPQIEDRKRRTSVEVLEHESIWFPSYPTEWPAGMLRMAAVTTLDLAQALLPCGLGLKDATPWNVLFRGPRAVWIDAPSLEERDPGDGIWLPLAQFLETFLYPLWIAQRSAIDSHELFLLHRNGVPAEKAWRSLGIAGRLRPAVFHWLTLPRLLARVAPKPKYSKDHRLSDATSAHAMLRRMFASLRRAVEKTAPHSGNSTHWKDYSGKCHYEVRDRQVKRDFVHGVLKAWKRGRVLDLGCNDGEYSEMAARLGHEVVAVDADAGVINRLWARACEHDLGVLPLIGNVANPTPGSGWRNAESGSFLARGAGRFDGVMALALLHHLTITERVPLAMVLDLIADFTRHSAIVEYVSPEDPMYQQLLRGRDHLHREDSRDAFEAAAGRRFDVAESLSLPGNRRFLYHLVRKGE
ncbi:MAG: class I SAM-dependent methyltransferase [Bryobacterales bacterium]|nr:class I SAM-dependent methyltransferase [Bryobacterales bacterium]